jgi:hypothetical protein
MTPAERTAALGDTSDVEHVDPGQNAHQIAPAVLVSPQALAEANRENIDFAAEAEPMSKFQLMDGTIISAKLVLMSVELVEGVYMPDGTPVYDCVWNSVTYVRSPEHLKRRPLA